MDADTFPVADDWLPYCVERIERGAGVVAVSLAEQGFSQAGGVFAMFTREGMERHGFDFSPVGVEGVGARLSGCVEEGGGVWHALRRSNRVNYDPYAAGLYDDRIYHHGAHPYRADGSAPEEPASDTRLAGLLTERLFRDPDRHLAELRGAVPAADIAALAENWRPARYPLAFHPALRLVRRLLSAPSRRGGSQPTTEPVASAIPATGRRG